MKSRILTWGIIGFVVLFVSTKAHAAGAILVDTDGSGQPILWQDGIIHYNLESGADSGLGSLNNIEASQLVRDLFEEWQNTTINDVNTVSITLDEGAGLGNVDTSNINDFFTYCPVDQSCPGETAPFNLGSARTGQSPIIFDADGSLTDAIQGEGASESILGFAGPRVIEESAGVLYITEGQAILNGKFIDGIDTDSNPEVSVDAFKGALFHELFHFMGGDHTQVNLSSVVKYLNDDDSEKDAIPTMLPLFIDGEAQLTPHYDDKVSISTLYPSASFQSSFCTLRGTTYRDDGETELQGVNVIISSADDPLSEAVSYVSGSLYTGTYDNCEAPNGNYILPGLIPGKNYNLRYERVSQAFTGGSSLEPCDPPQSGFDSGTVEGTFSCTSGAESITTGSSTTTTIVTNKEVESTSGTTTTTQGGGSSSGSSSSGGCSLVSIDTSK